jgi:hypothetical protein
MTLGNWIGTRRDRAVSMGPPAKYKLLVESWICRSLNEPAVAWVANVKIHSTSSIFEVAFGSLADP